VLSLTPAYLPTAVQALVAGQLTPESWLAPVPLFGLVATAQILPFQASTRVWYGPTDEFRYLPTAVHALLDAHETPRSWLSLVPTLGLAAIAQLVPFQVSIRVWLAPAVVLT
jgi:hypothetical protein